MPSLGPYTVAAGQTVAAGDKVILDNATGQAVKVTAGAQAGRYVAGAPFVAYAGHGATAGQTVILFDEPLSAMEHSAARVRGGQAP
jgi:hypothetical protein